MNSTTASLGRIAGDTSIVRFCPAVAIRPPAGMFSIDGAIMNGNVLDVNSGRVSALPSSVTGSIT